MRITILSLLLVFLMACAPANMPAEDTTAPSVEDEVADNVADESESQNDKADDSSEQIPETDDSVEQFPETEVGPFIQQNNGPIEVLACDSKTRTLTFEFSNPTDLTWQLNQDIPWPAPQGMAVVQIGFNSYTVNARQPEYFNGERMFGPEEVFSDNCEGDELLEPGESTTCTVSPLPLRETGFDAGTNELILRSTGVRGQSTFQCE